MSKYTVRTIKGAGYDDVHEVLYEDNVLLTLPTEELADAVVIALLAEYARGFWDGNAEGFEDGVNKGHDDRLSNG